MKKLVCDVCGQPAASLVTRPFATIIQDVRVHLDDVEMIACTACGEHVFTPEQSKEVSRRAKAFVRERLGLLPPEKVLEIRRRYDLSQEELETLLSLGKKVVTRWERGIVPQSRAADVVLRLMDRMPKVVDELRKIAEEKKTPTPV